MVRHPSFRYLANARGKKKNQTDKKIGRLGRKEEGKKTTVGAKTAFKLKPADKLGKQNIKPKKGKKKKLAAGKKRSEVTGKQSKEESKAN